MIIKEVPKQDLQQAKQLYCECFHKTYQATTTRIQGTILGMYQDNKLIGLAQIDYLNNFFENKKIAYINSLCIQEKYRHLGYGNQLLQECIKISKQNKADYINITSNKNRIYAHMLYHKNNFQPVDTILLKKEL